MKSIHSSALLAGLLAGLMPPAAYAQSITFNPVDIHLEKVDPSLPTLHQVDEITFRGVEYRNTTDKDASGTVTAGDTAVIHGVFAVTSFISKGTIVNLPGLNFSFEVTGTYVDLSDIVNQVSNGAVTYSTKAETGALTFYVSTDMTQRHSTLTGLGYDDGTVVAQFTVSPEPTIERGGVYKIGTPFDGSRDVNLILQSGLAGFFDPVISAANFDANQDADPDNNNVGGDVPVPTAWKYPVISVSNPVNYPFAYFSNVDGSSYNGTLNITGACRMTGGSVDVNGNILLGTQVSGTDDRFQTGGQIGAPTSALPQPSGEWTHHQQTGSDGRFTFHSGTASAPAESKILTVACSEPGYCQPARPAPFKRIFWDGVGTFKNFDSTALAEFAANGCPNVSTSTLHYYRALVEDIGEPGAGGVQLKKKSCNHQIGSSITPSECDSCPDAYQIEVHCTTEPSSPVIYSIGGFIDGGNFQIHPAVGEQRPTTTSKGNGRLK